MSYVVEPTELTGGRISVPGDKSISHRALMLGALAEGVTEIEGFLPGDDCLATLEALRLMGVQIDLQGATAVRVYGAGLHGLSDPVIPLDLGNSGTAMRLFAGLLSGQSFSSMLTGDESLSRRPMGRVIRPLEMMGARISSSDGCPPLRIEGNRTLGPVVYAMPVASAQVKSAILLAGLYADGDVVVVEPAPSRDHTERMLRTLGASLQSGERRVVLSGERSLTGTRIRVPGDLSSSAFALLAAVISSSAEVTVTGVGVNPTRTGFIEVMRSLGADISVDNVRLFGEEPVADITARPSALVGTDIDPALVPLAIDEFPALFIAAAAATGRTRFSGLAELRVKESDRIVAMADGLRALSVSVEELDDGAVVHGGKIYGGMVDSRGDHRIAMAFAVAGTIAEWAVQVRDTTTVATSFPGFAELMRSIGARIDEAPE